MAGGKTVPSQKRKPSHEMGMKENQVAKGSGRADPFGRDGSGSNKPAALHGTGIRAGKQTHVGMVENSGHDSPIGKERPQQNGGPRRGQTSGVDKKVGSFAQQGNGMHGHKPGKGSTNAFDLYSEARK